MEQESQYTILSVKKALKVLKLFDSTHKSMTLTEISARAEMRKGTMIRVLSTLAEEGFVRYDEISKRYGLGMTIYSLSSNAFQFTGLTEQHTGCSLHDKIISKTNISLLNKILYGSTYVCSRFFHLNISSKF